MIYLRTRIHLRVTRGAMNNDRRTTRVLRQTRACGHVSVWGSLPDCFSRVSGV